MAGKLVEIHPEVGIRASQIDMAFLNDRDQFRKISPAVLMRLCVSVVVVWQPFKQGFR